MHLAALAPSCVCVATPWSTPTDTLSSPGNTFPGAVVGDMRVERSERSRRREQRERETESKRLPRATLSAARGATTTRYWVVCWEILRCLSASRACTQKCQHAASSYRIGQTQGSTIGQVASYDGRCGAAVSPVASSKLTVCFVLHHADLKPRALQAAHFFCVCEIII
jgi:hypothetical protein